MARRRFPLGAIDYFEIAARHLNFNRAAAEAGVSPGAMSQRIKTLETYLGRALFVRSKRGVALTLEGQQLKQAAESALGTLERALTAIGDAPGKIRLVVTVSPYFGSRWLAPRLKSFWDLHPEVDLLVRQLRGPAPFAELNTDVLIRYGRENAPYLQCRPLLATATLAVGSPAFLAAHGPAGDAAVRGAMLLHVGDHQAWATWLEHSGIASPDGQQGHMFDDIHLAMEAAAAGQGIALGTRPVIDEDLRSGRLVKAHPFELVGDEGYVVCYATRSIARPEVKAFVTWVESQVS